MSYYADGIPPKGDTKKQLNEMELIAVKNMLEEAIDERLNHYIKTFGMEGAEQFIIENTKTMPTVRGMYMARYNVRLGR